jgi:hypothetical protein
MSMPECGLRGWPLKRLQREHRRSTGREFRQRGVRALGLRLDALQVIGRGVHLPLVLDRQVLRAIALVGDLEGHIDGLLAGRHLERVRARLGRQRNADDREPAIAVANDGGSSRVDQCCRCQVPAGNLDEGDAAGNAAFAG